MISAAVFGGYLLDLDSLGEKVCSCSRDEQGFDKDEDLFGA